MAEPAIPLLRVVSPQQLSEAEAEKRAQSQKSAQEQAALDNLAAHVRDQFFRMRRHRTNRGIDARLIEALRTYKGEYHPNKLAEIQQFGGSTVYSRLSSVKCRGATALLRDVFLASSRPWAVEPTPEPAVPTDVSQSIQTLISSEVQRMASAGMPVDPQAVKDRASDLVEAAERATMRKARDAAEDAADRLDDILVEGQFYQALDEFLADLPIYPFACIKGPVVQNRVSLRWDEQGAPVAEEVPQMYWRRVDPAQLYWTPGSSNILDADVCEVIKLSRAELNGLLGVEGYDEAAIRGALQDYGRGGLRDWLDNYDTEQAELQDKENPNTNTSELLDTLEFHGHLQGRLLRQYGMTDKQVPDPDRDYSCTVWVIGQYTIKAQLNPDPRKRHPYYVTSFEKIPGSAIGVSLIETLEDIQDIANASLRALVNNMSIASGPQAYVLTDRLAYNQDETKLYPWKQWRCKSDPMGGGQKPVEFFQPDSNAQELLGVYEKMTFIADEISAIPRYITGSSKVGGAGATASGLAMLMNNASKVMQSVASNVDRDILEPLLQTLYTYVMLTDTESLLRGDEQIMVRGVTVAMQKEAERARKLEFLQLTLNPLDSQIVGMPGRAAILRDIAKDLGMPFADIVPSEQELRDQQQMAQQMAMMQAAMNPELAAQGPGNNAAPPGSGDTMPSAQRGGMATTRTPGQMDGGPVTQGLADGGPPAPVPFADGEGWHPLDKRPGESDEDYRVRLDIQRMATNEMLAERAPNRDDWAARLGASDPDKIRTLFNAARNPEQEALEGPGPYNARWNLYGSYYPDDAPGGKADRLYNPLDWEILEEGRAMPRRGEVWVGMAPQDTTLTHELRHRGNVLSMPGGHYEEAATRLGDIRFSQRPGSERQARVWLEQRDAAPGGQRREAVERAFDERQKQAYREFMRRYPDMEPVRQVAEAPRGRATPISDEGKALVRRLSEDVFRKYGR